MIALTNEELLSTVEAYRLHGSQRKAAKALGIVQSSLVERLHRAAKLGLLGYEPVLPGFEVARASVSYDADGEVKATHVTQKPEPGEAFAVPAGHTIKGISSLVDRDGRTVQSWIKTREDASVADLLAAVTTTFDAYKGRAPAFKAPKDVAANTLTVYNLADHHLGLLAWKPETGNNYDLHIAEHMLRDTLAELVAAAPASETGVLLNLGDFLHSQSNENRTPRSGVQLDVEGRYAKVLTIGVGLLVYGVELLLTKHKKVVLRNIPGNHDALAALALSIALSSFFHSNPRVEIDTSPSPFWKYKFGKVLLTSTHGDMIKPEQMPAVIASYFPKEWGETEFRYCYLGHLHNKIKGGGENHGLIYEVFQTLAAKDIWHYSSGYSSGRSMVAITHDKDHGEKLRHTVSVPRFEQEKV